MTELARGLLDIAETLEDNPDAPEWMIAEMAAKARELAGACS
jgi:hypothetical protein